MTQVESLEELAGRIAELETRVARLEHAPDAAASSAPVPPLFHSGPTAEPGKALNPVAVLGSIGIAGLGIAGAYLLRAISGPGLLPRPAAAVVAVGYSIAWMVAARQGGLRNRFASGIFACTSMLILGPMLWEMCIRFHATSALVAASVLVVYLAAAGSLLRGLNRLPAFSIVFSGSALTALALAVATHEMLPFTAILLAMAAWREVARFRGLRLPVSWIVSLAADAAVWAMLVVYRAPAASRPEYPALDALVILAAPFLLLALQVASVGAATIMRREAIAVFDVLQACAALTLTGCGLFWLLPNSGQTTFAVIAVVVSGVGYAAAFGTFRGDDSLRNRRVFASWGALLGVLGIGLLLPMEGAAVVIGIAAIMAVFMSVRLRSVMLLAHGMLFLTLAGVGSGLAVCIVGSFVGTGTARLTLAIVAVSIFAAAGYVICGERWIAATGVRALRFVAALWVAGAVCALLTQGLWRVSGLGLSPEIHKIALLRMAVLCLVALGLAITGRRRGRKEMVPVAYTLLALGIAKLFFEDLRHGHLAFTAGSICLVALTLIAVPRMAVRQPTAPGD